MKLCLLLRIISRVCENSGIKSAPNSVAAFDHNTVVGCFQKFIVEEYHPLRMHDFSTTMNHQGFDGAIGSHVITSKVFERIWELQWSGENRTRKIE